MNDVNAPYGAKDARQDVGVAGSVLPGSGAVGGIDALIAAMFTRPQDFTLSSFTLTDSKTDVSVWIANGWGSYGIHRPSEYDFSLFEQFKFARAFKKWRALWLAHRLAKGTV